MYFLPSFLPLFHLWVFTSDTRCHSHTSSLTQIIRSTHALPHADKTMLSKFSLTQITRFHLHFPFHRLYNAPTHAHPHSSSLNTMVNELSLTTAISSALTMTQTSPYALTATTQTNPCPRQIFSHPEHSLRQPPTLYM